MGKIYGKDKSPYKAKEKKIKQRVTKVLLSNSE